MLPGPKRRRYREYIYILRYRRRFGGDRRGPDGFTFTEAAAGRFTFQTAVSFSNSRFVGFIFKQPFRRFHFSNSRFVGFIFQTTVSSVSFSNNRFVGFIFKRPFRYLVISICVSDDRYVSVMIYMCLVMIDMGPRISKLIN